MNKLLIILLIIGLFLLSVQVAFAQKLPENLKDSKNIGQKILDSILGSLKKGWEETVKIWKNMWEWFKNIWNSYIFPFLKFIWQKILSFFLKSINKILENIWQKIKELIVQKLK